MKCQKCQADNPDDTFFCGNCGIKLPSQEGFSISHTRTLYTPIKESLKGTTFAGRYRIVDELGRGGMGVVYKALDTKLKRTVALKFLPTELTHISEIKERFLREAQAAAALDHPNICTVHEFDEAEGKAFISMTYMEGQSLKKKIESGPVELDEALRIFKQAADGLQEAHKKGVVHRDIKSANIMLDSRGQAKIMDFGLARVAGGTLLTKDGMTMGTVAYMSPEQARGEDIDQRSDIWSLGVVFYELLTGQLPFKGEHDQAVMYSILNEQPKPVTDLQVGIPEVLEQIVAKALDKNPNQRYQNIDELLDDLESISEGVEPEGIKARLRKKKLVKRKKAFLYASIAGVIVIMTVLWLSLFTRRAEAMDSIAVLPVENLSGDPDQEYFSDGITDALINELAKISALRVISRQSVMHYKGSEKSLPVIARELNVDAVVEASALKIGGRVQIRTRLIQAATEQNLWAQSYEREISDILIMQSEMARAIAREVKIKLTPQEETRFASSGSINPEAYEAYLKGQFHWYKLTSKDLETSLRYFQLALEKDPDSALAYAGIANVWSGQMAMGFVPAIEAAPKAKAAAAKALELDDTLAEVHYALALVAWIEWDWEGVWAGFRRAIELNPNYASARAYYSNFLHIMKRPEEAMVQIEIALKLDPFNPLFQAIYAMDLMYAHRYDDAIELLRNTLRTAPNDPVSLSTLRSAYHQKHMYKEALEIWKASYAAKGDHEAEAALALGNAEDGYSGALSRAAETLIARSRTTYVTSWQIGTLYTRAGKNDKAFEWLEKAYEEHDSNMPYLSVDPIFDSLRDEPRYWDLLRRMNLPVNELSVSPRN